MKLKKKHPKKFKSGDLKWCGAGTVGKGGMVVYKEVVFDQCDGRSFNLRTGDSVAIWSSVEGSNKSDWEANWAAQVESMWETSDGHKEFQARWYYKKQDIQEISSEEFVDRLGRRKMLLSLTENDLVLSDNRDMNNLVTICKPITVVFQNPSQKTGKAIGSGTADDPHYVCRYTLSFEQTPTMDSPKFLISPNAYAPVTKTNRSSTSPVNTKRKLDNTTENEDQMRAKRRKKQEKEDRTPAKNIADNASVTLKKNKNTTGDKNGKKVVDIKEAANVKNQKKITANTASQLLDTKTTATATATTDVSTVSRKEKQIENSDSQSKKTVEKDPTVKDDKKLGEKDTASSNSTATTSSKSAVPKTTTKESYSFVMEEEENTISAEMLTKLMYEKPKAKNHKKSEKGYMDSASTTNTPAKSSVPKTTTPTSDVSSVVTREKKITNSENHSKKLADKEAPEVKNQINSEKKQSASSTTTTTTKSVDPQTTIADVTSDVMKNITNPNSENDSKKLLEKEKPALNKHDKSGKNQSATATTTNNNTATKSVDPKTTAADVTSVGMIKITIVNSENHHKKLLDKEELAVNKHDKSEKENSTSSTTTSTSESEDVLLSKQLAAVTLETPATAVVGKAKGASSSKHIKIPEPKPITCKTTKKGAEQQSESDFDSNDSIAYTILPHRISPPLLVHELEKATKTLSNCDDNLKAASTKNSSTKEQVDSASNLQRKPPSNNHQSELSAKATNELEKDLLKKKLLKESQIEDGKPNISATTTLTTKAHSQQDNSKTVGSTASSTKDASTARVGGKATTNELQMPKGGGSLSSRQHKTSRQSTTTTTTREDSTFQKDETVAESKESKHSGASIETKRKQDSTEFVGDSQSGAPPQKKRKSSLSDSSLPLQQSPENDTSQSKKNGDSNCFFQNTSEKPLNRKEILKKMKRMAPEIPLYRIFLPDPEDECILNVIEMELAWLAEESLYCLGCIQWTFFSEYASRSLKKMLPLHLVKNDSMDESTKEKQIIESIVRMDCQMVAKRFACYRGYVRLALKSGFRRDLMRSVIARLRMTIGRHNKSNQQQTLIKFPPPNYDLACENALQNRSISKRENKKRNVSDTPKV